MRFRLPARGLLGTLLAVSAAVLPGATLVPASADFGPSCVGVVRGVQPDGTGTTSTVRRMEFNAETGEVIARSVDYALPYRPVLMAYGPWKTAFAVTSDGKLHHLHTSLTGGPTLDRVVGTGWGRRVAEVRRDALAMAKGAVVTPAASAMANGKANVPQPTTARGATTATVVVASAGAAQAAASSGASWSVIAAILVGGALCAVAGWIGWTFWHRHKQETPAVIPPAEPAS